MLVQDSDLRALADAAALVAVREAANHLLHYGSHVALNHTKTVFLDIPSVSDKLARITQALQRDCDMLHHSQRDGVMTRAMPCQQAFQRHISPVVKPLASGSLAATGIMWPALNAKIEAIKNCSLQSKHGELVLVVVDAAAEEFAFQMIAGLGVAIKLLGNFSPAAHTPAARQARISTVILQCAASWSMPAEILTGAGNLGDPSKSRGHD